MNHQTFGTSNWKRARSGLRTLVVAALLATPAGAAEVLDDDAPEPQDFPSRSKLEFSATGTLATDYINKGVSQTDRGPAVQASFDIGYGAFYLGTWASNVDFGGDTTASGEIVDAANFEIDFYGGIKKKLNRVSVELGALYYHYPNSFAPEGSFDYIEYKAAVGAEFFKSSGAELKVLYSPDYSGGLGKTVNVEGKLTQPLRRGFEVSGALGYFEDLDDLPILADGSTNYWYWNAGVSKTFKERYTLDLRYWDTSGSSECRDVPLVQCDARMVGQLSASFLAQSSWRNASAMHDEWSTKTTTAGANCAAPARPRRLRLVAGDPESGAGCGTTPLQAHRAILRALYRLKLLSQRDFPDLPGMPDTQAPGGAAKRGLPSGAGIVLCLLLAFAASVAFAGPIETCEQNRNLDRQTQDCTRILKLAGLSHSQRAAACTRRDDDDSDNGEDDGTIARLTNAIRFNPGFPPAYARRGKAYVDKGEYERAIIDYTFAIRLDPGFAEAYIGRGAAYTEKGSYDRAIADHTKAIELSPRSATAYKNRGDAYAEKGEDERAIADYTMAIRLDPGYAEAYAGRGFTYSEQADDYRAVADHTAAIQLNPTSASAYNNRGQAYHRAFRYDYAIADYAMAIRLSPKYASAYSNRGVAHAKMGQLSRAVADYSMAIQLNPESAIAHNNRGIAYGKAGQHGAALLDFGKAIELDPRFAVAYANRGVAHLGLGNARLAFADLRQAVELAPEDAGVRRSLGEGFLYARDQAKARKAWRSACSLASKAQTRTWQHELLAQGHYAGAIDGACGDSTIMAFHACALARCNY